MSFQFSVLDNGLTVAADSFSHSAFVVIEVWVKVGARFEVESNNGMAHFLEHMAFKGTSSRTAQDIAVAFDNLGAVFNAHTGKENTVYYVKVLRECFDAAFEILSDIILNSSFDSKELAREQSVVLEEIAETNDDPASLLFDKFVEVAFPNQSIGRSILGTKETVLSFTRDSVVDFVGQHYRADNMLILVAGNVVFEELLAKTNKFFGFIRSLDNPLVIDKAHYVHSLQYREERDLEQVHTIFGVEGVSISDLSYYPLQLLSVILGGSMSSRLFQEVREKRGLVYSISSFSMSYADVGVFGIYACATPNNLTQLIDVIFAELKKMREGAFLVELERAKTQLKASIFMKMEDVMGRANHIGKCLQYFGTYVPFEDLIAKIEAVTINDISDVIHQIMNFKKFTLGAIGRLDLLPVYDDIVNMF